MIESRFIQPGPAAFFGCSRYTKTILKTCKGRGVDYFYCDNGYLRASKRHADQIYDGYYRVTRNAEQVSSIHPSDGRRFRELDIELKPWRKTGRYILVAMQSSTYFNLRGYKAPELYHDLVYQICKHTDRPIIIRPKPSLSAGGALLDGVLDDVHAVVTVSSNVAIDALIKGIPCITTWPCAGTPLSMSFDDLEDGVYGDREPLFNSLADNQWTLDEFRSGKCWGDLNEAVARPLAAG